jgi:hypothetical protein
MSEVHRIISVSFRFLLILVSCKLEFSLTDFHTYETRVPLSGTGAEPNTRLGFGVWGLVLGCQPQAAVEKLQLRSVFIHFRGILISLEVRFQVDFGTRVQFVTNSSFLKKICTSRSLFVLRELRGVSPDEVERTCVL